MLCMRGSIHRLLRVCYHMVKVGLSGHCLGCPRFARLARPLAAMLMSSNYLALQRLALSECCYRSSLGIWSFCKSAVIRHGTHSLHGAKRLSRPPNQSSSVAALHGMLPCFNPPPSDPSDSVSAAANAIPSKYDRDIKSLSIQSQSTPALHKSPSHPIVASRAQQQRRKEGRDLPSERASSM